MSEIEALVKELSQELIGATIDLRYGGGKWSVFRPRGNMMDIIPGTVTDDPVKSLQIALDRWRNRSPENPF